MVDVIEETDISVKSSDVELVEEIITPETQASSEKEKEERIQVDGF